MPAIEVRRSRRSPVESIVPLDRVLQDHTRRALQSMQQQRSLYEVNRRRIQSGALSAKTTRFGQREREPRYPVMGWPYQSGSLPKEFDGHGHACSHREGREGESLHSGQRGIRRCKDLPSRKIPEINASSVA